MTGAASWRERVAVHPAAAMFDMMTDPELGALAANIAEHGLNQSIVFWTPDNLRDFRQGRSDVFLLDGRNRLDAIERAFKGDPEKQAQEVEGALYIDRQPGCATLLYGDIDPYAYAASANAHRRHLTPEKKREVIADLLKARPERSDRATARLVGRSDKTVAAVRRELEGRAEIPNVSTRTDTAGRQQSATKPPRPPKQSKEAQIRALREHQVAPPISKSGAAYYAEHPAPPQSALAPPARHPPDQPLSLPTATADEQARLVQLLKVLQANPRHYAGWPLAKRVALARTCFATCLAVLDVTLDDLRAP